MRLQEKEKSYWLENQYFIFLVPQSLVTFESRIQFDQNERTNKCTWSIMSTKVQFVISDRWITILPVSQSATIVVFRKRCAFRENRQTDNQTDRNREKKESENVSRNKRCYATNAFCLLSIFFLSLPFFVDEDDDADDDDDDGYTALQTNSRRMIFYLRHTREELLVWMYLALFWWWWWRYWNETCAAWGWHIYNETWEKERDAEKKKPRRKT